MTAAIEAQVERFAPGFRDLIVARSAMDSAEVERRNPNYVGGDINGGSRPAPALHPAGGRPSLLDAASRPVPLLGVDPARRRGARHVRLLGGARGAAQGVTSIRSSAGGAIGVPVSDGAR